MRHLIAPARKLLALPPEYLRLRAGAELAPYVDRAPAGAVESRVTTARLLRAVAAPSINALHARVMSAAMPWTHAAPDAAALEAHAPGERARLAAAADRVLAGAVDLLGSGPVTLTSGTGEIDWHKDYKSGHRWPFAYFHELDPSDLSRNSDVKFPWELSRLQWLLPVAQAWRLTGDERYARFAKATLEHWMAHNPYAWGINWACTMEPAMRVFTWTWLYAQMADAPGWQDAGFRGRMLQAIYLHLRFVRRFIEVSDVNGNHLTADAAALVAGGRFFGEGRPVRWMATGWRLLEREMPRQVYADGVDFEGSTSYHRLVAELFHVAACAWSADGRAVGAPYRDRLLRMAGYTEAYTRPDGLAPVAGDNDDTRTLPLGDQPVGDHRYLPALIRARWAPGTLSDAWRDNAAECLWWWGREPASTASRPAPSSARFADGGIGVLRSARDYVFFTAAPLGLAGRGGHSHNDALSFEAVLDGSPLIVDPGCLVYTASAELRNRFRATASHGTPQVDGEEINRFPASDSLWMLRHDARPVIEQWDDAAGEARVAASHDGYRRLDPPVTVRRTLRLDKVRHALHWEDAIEPDGPHAIRVPVQLAPSVSVSLDGARGVTLASAGARFALTWEAGAGWQLQVESGTVAPRYGVAIEAPRLLWTRASNGRGGLRVTIAPIPN